MEMLAVLLSTLSVSAITTFAVRSKIKDRENFKFIISKYISDNKDLTEFCSLVKKVKRITIFKLCKDLNIDWEEEYPKSKFEDFDVIAFYGHNDEVLAFSIITYYEGSLRPNKILTSVCHKRFSNNKNVKHLVLCVSEYHFHYFTTEGYGKIKSMYKNTKNRKVNNNISDIESNKYLANTSEEEFEEILEEVSYFEKILFVKSRLLLLLKHNVSGNAYYTENLEKINKILHYKRKKFLNDKPIAIRENFVICETTNKDQYRQILEEIRHIILRNQKYFKYFIIECKTESNSIISVDLKLRKKYLKRRDDSNILENIELLDEDLENNFYYLINEVALFANRTYMPNIPRLTDTYVSDDSYGNFSDIKMTLNREIPENKKTYENHPYDGVNHVKWDWNNDVTINENVINEGTINKVFLLRKVKPRLSLEQILKHHSYPGLYNLVKRSNDLDELLYLRKDCNNGMATFRTIRDRIIKCKQNGLTKETERYYNGIKKKYIDKNITEKDVQLTMDWYKNVYLKLLTQRIKDLRKG